MHILLNAVGIAAMILFVVWISGPISLGIQKLIKKVKL